MAILKICFQTSFVFKVMYHDLFNYSFFFFQNYLFSAYYVPSTLLSSEDTAKKIRKTGPNQCSCGAYSFHAERKTIAIISKYIKLYGVLQVISVVEKYKVG